MDQAQSLSVIGFLDRRVPYRRLGAVKHSASHAHDYALIIQLCIHTAMSAPEAVVGPVTALLTVGMRLAGKAVACRWRLECGSEHFSLRPARS